MFAVFLAYRLLSTQGQPRYLALWAQPSMSSSRLSAGLVPIPA